MIVKCPIHNVRYERFDSDKYATEDCPRCLSDRKHNSKFTYEEGVKSGNRLLVLFSVFLVSLIFCMAFVSAIETKGGVYNGGFEYGTGQALTSGSWVGDKNYGWLWSATGNYSVNYMGFDNTKFHSGTQSMKLDINKLDSNSTLGSSDLVYFGTSYYPGSTVSQNSGVQIYYAKLKPSTNYKISYWVDLNKQEWTQLSGTAKPILRCFVTPYNSSFVRLSSTGTGSKRITSTTNGDFNYGFDSFVTPATVSFGVIHCGAVFEGTGVYSDGNLIGNIDDVRLEEVDTLSLSSQASGRPSITITGVTDTEAIDQSQTTGGFSTGFGTANVNYVSQSITPTQSKITGITLNFYKTGNPSDSLKLTIQGQSSDVPNGTIYASYTVAGTSLLTTSTDYYFPLPFISNLAKYTVKLERTGDLNDTDYYGILRSNTTSSYTGGKFEYYNGSVWAEIGDAYFKTHFAKLSSSIDLNVVAPDGTSELKSYDVNGDILTDANITINPDGTGRYYYFADPTQSNGFQTTDVWVNDIYQSSLGGGATYLGINGWTKTSLNGGKIYTANDAGATERYLTWKIKAPNNCNFSDINTMISSISSSGELGSRVLQYSFDNSTWVNTDINFNEYDGALTTKSDNFNIDGNNVVYLRFWKNNKGYLQFLNLTIDANMSCGSTTTPLFKSGTNTVYTMNKDATQQNGATLTPSLMSNINFIQQAVINTYDENTNLPLEGVNINFNGNNYTTTDSLTPNTIPLTGLTAGNEYTLTFSKTGYSTRTYNFTASTTNFINLNLALLPTDLSQEINFKFFEPDEITAYANIYIETKKGTLTLGRQKTNTLGEITINLDQNATGITFDMNNGENTYQAVLLTINRPKSETTLLDIPENWGYEISGLASYIDSNVSTNTKVFAIYSNTVSSYSIQISSASITPEYTPRKYDVQIIGDQNTYTLQPYLINTEVSVTTTLYTINAYTNQAISDVTIKIYRNLPVTGRTLIEQTITDAKGQSIVYLILNQTYSFEISIGETIIRTETYTITATSAGIWFKIDPGYVFETKPALNNVLTYWTPGKNWLGESDANISTKIEYQTAVSNTRTVSIVRITCDNDGDELFQDNFSNPTVPFTQTYDFNLITKTINSVNFDGNYPITCLTRITLNDGNIIEATQTYVVRNDSPQQNLGFNLRPVFGCTATNDPNVPCPSMIFFALLSTMMLTAGIMIESGFTQPEFAGILFFVGLGFFTFFTWIPPFLYVVALVIALLVYVALGVRRI